MKLRCHRCVRCTPAVIFVNDQPVCRSCARELLAKPVDLKIRPAKNKRTALAVLMSLLMLAGATAAALEPTNGAREGESLDARIERLRGEIEERQVALRLSLAERRVRAGRR